ncbi:MAG: DUF2231 domain-containing protein [Lentimicrobiaceae bacterium]|jgi:uncharacterized membrane protein
MFDTSHLHPVIVHFPIALLIVGFVADTVYMLYKKEACLSKVGFYLMLAGTLGAIAAVLSGNFFTEDMSGSVEAVRERHETFANITMYVMIVASILRIFLVYKGKAESKAGLGVYLLYLIGVITVGYTGMLGGTMVFNYMIGL